MDDEKNEYEMPEHLKVFKRKYDAIVASNMRLPLLSMLSPRTRNQISRLPPPNENDKAAVEQLNEAVKMVDPEIAYGKLVRASDHSRAMAHYTHQSERWQQTLRLVPLDGKPVSDVVTSLPAEKMQLDFSSSAYFDSVVRRKQRLVESGVLPPSAAAANVTNRGLLPQSGETTSMSAMLLRPASQRAVKRLKMAANGPEQGIMGGEGPSLDPRPATTGGRRPGSRAVPNRKSVRLSRPVSPSGYHFSIDIHSPVAGENNACMIQSRQDFMDNLKTAVYNEMKVDIDPEFTKKRLFSNALKLMVYHISRVKLRYTLQHFVRQVRLAVYYRNASASTSIQRCSRGMLARSIARDLRRHHAAQQEAEHRKAILIQQLRSAAAKAVYIFIRRKITRDRVRRRRGRTVKRKWRRVFAVLSANLWFIRVWKKHFNAALTIQCIVRQCISYRKLLEAKEHRTMIELLEKERLTAEQAKLKALHYKSVECIKRYYRVWRIKAFMKSLIYWRRWEMVVKIEKVFRGHLGRNLAKNIRLRVQQETTRQFKAALTIQLAWHCFGARERFHKVQEEHRRLRLDRLDKKAALLQPSSRTARNRMIRKILRSMHPFRFLFENKKALIIQKNWRGHYKRLRCKVIKEQQLLSLVFQKARRLKRLAIRIQKVFRGFCIRRELIRKRIWRSAVIVQRYWRRHLARIDLNRRRIRAKAIQRIQSRILPHFFRMKERVYQRRVSLLVSNVVVIQRTVRLFLSRQHRNRKKRSIRSRIEMLTVAYQRTQRILYEIQLKIIFDSIGRDIASPLTTCSGLSCPSNGPIQHLFINTIGYKAETESDALATNRLDSKNFIRFANEIEVFMTMDKRRRSTMALRRESSSSRESPHRSLLTRSRSVHGHSIEEGDPHYPKKLPACVMDILALNPTILQVDQVIFPTFTLPSHLSTVNATDFDICFTKARRDKKSATPLSYLEYIRCMHHLALIFYRDIRIEKRVSGGRVERAGVRVKRKSMMLTQSPSTQRRSIAAADAIVDENSSSVVSDTGVASSPSIDDVAIQDSSRDVPQWDNIHTDANQDDVEAGQSESESEYDSESDSQFPRPLSRNASFFYPSTGRSRFDDPESLRFSMDVISDSKSASFHGSMTLALYFITSFKDRDWVGVLKSWLDVESRARLGRFVIRVQCMARQNLARASLRAKRKQRRETEEGNVFSHRIRRLQAAVRGYLARKRVAKLAQASLLKYDRHDGQTYWYHPYTRRTSWMKPKVLRDMECRCLFVPQKGFELVIECSECGEVKDGVSNCDECEESYCDGCFRQLHGRGERAKHAKTAIPACSYCGYQVATVNCSSCALQHPAKGSLQQLVKASARAFFCDYCFANIHDADKNRSNKRKLAYEILNYTTEAYLIRQTLHQQPLTSHRFQSMTQQCEECNFRAASWRCLDCAQVYCHPCLHGLHSIGGPFAKHKAELLPYYTRRMHASYLRGKADQVQHKKFRDVMRRESLRREKIRREATVVVQKWWRRIFFSRRGKQLMKVQRKKLRYMWRNRVAETREKRGSLLYKMQNTFGARGDGSYLATDTPEEAALRSVSIFARSKARQYISRNLEDWGWYRNLRKLRSTRSAWEKIEDDDQDEIEDDDDDENATIVGLLAKRARREAKKAMKKAKVMAAASVKDEALVASGNPVRPDEFVTYPEFPRRKGMPKVGFAVGSIPELIDQARRGGYRLPGGVFLETFTDRHKTVTDLTHILPIGSLVRVGPQLFRVCDIEGKEIVFDRKWLSTPSSLAEVIYTVPYKMGEKGSLYFNFKFYVGAFMRKNPVAQVARYIHFAWLRLVVNDSMCRAFDAKQSNDVKALQKHRSQAILAAKRAKWTSNFFTWKSGGATVRKPAPPTVAAVAAEAALYGEGDVKLVGDESLARQTEWTEVELLEEAEQWVKVAGKKGKEHYVNKATQEVFLGGVPRSVKLKEELDKEKEKRAAEFEEANKRIAEIKLKRDASTKFVFGGKKKK